MIPSELAVIESDRNLYREAWRLRGERADALEAQIEAVTQKVKRIHEILKRGKRTEDHGLMMNLDCILDHLVDADFDREV